MTLTPSEIAMMFLLGDYGFPRSGCKSLHDSLRSGRRILCEITGQDFRYDVKQWHEYLIVTDDGGYSLNKRTGEFETRIAKLDTDKDWCAVRDELDEIPDPPLPRSPPPDAPLPTLEVGDPVTVLQNHRNHTIRRGRVRHIEWHFKDQKWMYYLASLDWGKNFSKRYYEDDLDPPYKRKYPS